jgi:hypothetical protein
MAELPAPPNENQMLQYQLEVYPDVGFSNNDVPIPNGVVETDNDAIDANKQTMKERAEQIILIDALHICGFTLAQSICLTTKI